MIFTGNNILSLPQISQFYFEFDDIIVDNYGKIVLGFISNTQETDIILSGGRILVPTTGINYNFIDSYNIQEPFSLSGWYMPSSRNTGSQIYGFINDIPFLIPNLINSLSSGISINVTSGSLTTQLSLKSQPINYNLQIGNQYQINTSCSGQITSNAPVWVYSGSLIFYNSLQGLLTGVPVIAPLDPIIQTNLFFPDIDPTLQNNDINFALILNTLNGPIENNFRSKRMGLFDGIMNNFQSLNTNNTISGLFDGIWSGNQFIYQDVPQSITLNYYVSKTNSVGNALDETITLSWNPYPNITTFNSNYVTGFTLTQSGQYLSPPSAQFTGYYYVTGLQQWLGSMLFSSGCSGNLNVNFLSDNTLGTGANGYLTTHPVNFQDIYINGINTFYVVDAYNAINYGTGYTMPPRAIINTGQYSNCYDLPGNFGTNIAWFLPARTSGTVSPLAAYLTGEVLYTTGLVSGGILTGYLVTGINITNIGSGYNANYLPFVSFIRAVGDTLTGNASGLLFLKSDSNYDFYNHWSLYTGIAGTTLTQLSSPNGSFNIPKDKNYFSLRLTSSGLDNTQPLIANITLSTSVGYAPYNEYVTGTKYFSTDTGILKKKHDIETGFFNTGIDLSFTLSQLDLDSFYSTNGFTNNQWNVDLGDLDF